MYQYCDVAMICSDYCAVLYTWYHDNHIETMLWYCRIVGLHLSPRLVEGAKVAAGTDEAVVEVDGFLRADKRKHPGPAA